MEVILPSAKVVSIPLGHCHRVSVVSKGAHLQLEPPHVLLALVEAIVAITRYSSAKPGITVIME